MFIRRLFYNKSTGDIVYRYVATGRIVIHSIDEDFATIQELKNYSLEEMGVLEWLEPDEEIEEKMCGRYDVSIDISSDLHKLVFTELPEPEPIPEDEQPVTTLDCLEAFEELGVM